ncbi:MAG: thioester domain-containing protein [Vulcanimicrobiota bacterium]
MKRLISILLLGFLVGPVWAQEATSVLNMVRTLSQEFRDKVDNGLAEVDWTGLGLVSGDMVDMELTNTSDVVQSFRFVPGMILQDPGKKVQPIVLEENLKFDLEPGETIRRRMRGYCLDYSKDPPVADTREDYQITTDLTGYEDVVEVLYNGLRLDRDQKLKPVLRPLTHRTIVIQRAIWAVLGGDNPTTKDELEDDLEEEIKYRSSIFPEGQLDCLAERIWADVQKVMAVE